MIRALLNLICIALISACSSSNPNKTQQYSLHQQSQRFLSSLSFEDKEKARHNNKLEIQAKQLNDDSSRELQTLLSQMFSIEILNVLSTDFEQSTITFPVSISKSRLWVFSIKNTSVELKATILNSQLHQVNTLKLKKNPYLSRSQGIIEFGQITVEEKSALRSFSLLEKDLIGFAHTLGAQEKENSKKHLSKVINLKKNQQKKLGRLIRRWDFFFETFKGKNYQKEFNRAPFKPKRQIFTASNSQFQWHGTLADDQQRSLTVSSPKAKLILEFYGEDQEQIAFTYTEYQGLEK